MREVKGFLYLVEKCGALATRPGVTAVRQAVSERTHVPHTLMVLLIGTFSRTGISKQL